MRKSAIFSLTLAVILTVGAAHASGQTVRVSVSAGGLEGDRDSYVPAFTPDGRFMVFTSQATNLVPGDTNGSEDVFLRDFDAGTVERISLSITGSEGNYHSHVSSIGPVSADGRFVAFTSGARNLIPGDTNGLGDVFVRDRSTGTTVMASSSADGIPGTSGAFNPALSANGRYVAFRSFDGGLVPGDINQHYDILLKDLSTGAVEVVSRGVGGAPADGHSWATSISADGRFVAFDSDATNLVPGDTNGRTDAFLRDRVMNTTILVSRGMGGVPSNGWTDMPWISRDGRWVAFTSVGTNLVPDDTNEFADTFLFQRETNQLQRIMAPDNAQPDGQVSVSSISSDGRYIGLWADATNLSPQDGNHHFDAFRVDRHTGSIERVSARADGSAPVFGSRGAAVSDRADIVGFSSYYDIVPEDGNGFEDVFVRGVFLGDGDPPETVISTGPSDPTNSTSATFTFGADEPATFACSLDGGTFARCVSPLTLEGLGEASHTFSVQARDVWGNTDPTPASHSWMVDVTPPFAMMANANHSAFVTAISPVLLRASVEDPPLASGEDGSGIHSVCFDVGRVYLDAGPVDCFPATSGDEWTSSPDLSSGAYDVSVRTLDRAGNEAISDPIRIYVV